MQKRQPPLRPTAKPRVPTCDHCRKPCSKGIVRSADGVFCSPKHQAAWRTLRAVAAEPEVVDVGAAISTALARRGIPAVPDNYVAPPIMTASAQQVFTAWLANKSPDTQASYQASAAHFARWLVKEGHAADHGHPWDKIMRALQVPEDQGNAMIAGWISAQLATPSRSGGPANKASIALRCSGVKTLCEVLKGCRLIPYVPMFKSRPRKQKRSMVATRLKYAGVEEAFFTICEGLEPLASREDATVADIRDWAITALCSQLGFRRIEVVRLSVLDVDFATKHIQVFGKGRDEKEPMAMSPHLIKALKRWMKVRAEIVEDPSTGPLFVSLGRGYGGPINDRGTLNHMITRRAQQFGVKLRPHDLRRIQCTVALRELGAEKAIGVTRHADTATVMLYDLDAGKDLDQKTLSVATTIAKGRRKMRTSKK